MWPTLVPSTHNADICIEPGLTLRCGPTVFRIADIHGDMVTLQHTITPTDRRITKLSRLLTEMTQGTIVPADDHDVARASDGDAFLEDDQLVLTKLPLADLSEAQTTHVLRLMRYISGLRKLGYVCLTPKNALIQLELDRLQRRHGDPKRPLAAWVYKWSLCFDRSGGDPRSLIPQYGERGGKGKTKIAQEVEHAIETVLNRKKTDSRARIVPAKVVSEAKTLLQIEYPTRPELSMAVDWNTVDRRIKDQFSAYELCVRKHGKSIADQKYRDWYPREKAEFPLAVWETDDTDSCVFLVDERSGLPAGRGIITAVIDQHSLVIPGLEISNQPRSSWSAISALVNAILPKDLESPAFAECRSGCEFYGKPGVIVFDNALYNHAAEIELSVGSLGFIAGWAKPKTPTEKSCQEGWNGRLKSEFVPDLPGFRGEKKYRDGLREGMASATMGLLIFRQLLMKWIYDDYSNTPLADGLSARQKWHVGMRHVKHRLPRDIWGHKLVPCLHHTLKHRPEGILFCGLIYTVPYLKTLRDRWGHNSDVQFRFNPGDLREIYVRDPITKSYFPVPSTNPEYTSGLSLYQHRLVRKLCRENKIKNPSVPQLLLYRDELRVLTEQLRNSKRLRERTRATRTGAIPSNDAVPQPQERYVMTELESKALEIEEVEMDMDEDGWNLMEAA